MARHWKCVADGHGTSFCPLECPVRPNDPIVNIHAYAHTDNICEVSQFRNQKAKKDRHDWQLYSMQKAHCGVISVQWSLCFAPVFITWMRHSFKKNCNAVHIKHIPSCCCCFFLTFFLYWGGKIFGLLELCVWVCVHIDMHWHVIFTCPCSFSVIFSFYPLILLNIVSFKVPENAFQSLHLMFSFAVWSKNLGKGNCCFAEGHGQRLGCSIMVANIFIWHTVSITLLGVEKHHEGGAFNWGPLCDARCILAFRGNIKDT